MTISNSGSISGGLAGDGVTRGNAIEFTGGANTLTTNGGSYTGGIGISNANSGTLTLAQTAAANANQSATYLNVISGNGAVIVATDSGYSVTLSAANTYSGGTTVSGGTLQLSGAGTLGATTGNTTINTGGTLDLGSTMQTQAAVTLAGGTIQNGDLDAPLTSTGGTINGLGGTASLDATSGTTIVSGANTFTGGTTVTNATLTVNGSLSDPTIGSGGVLNGIGSVGTTQINAGGTFAPGNGTPGSSMTIAGNLAFQSGALYVVYLNPNTSSFANVTGTATLAGTLSANFASGTYLGKQYTVLQSTGLSGTFSGLATTNLPFGFDASLSYNADDAFLNLSAALGVGTPLNQNQRNVASAINNYFNSVGVLPPNFVNLFNLSGGNLANALTHLDGEDATGAETSAFDLMNEFLGLMLDPFVDGRGGSPASGGALGFAPDQQAEFPPDVALAYAGLLKAPAPSHPSPASGGGSGWGFAQRWSTWAAGFGGSGTSNSDPTVGSNNVTTSTYGYAAGMDYHLSPDTVLGFSLAGGGTNWNLADALGTGRSDAFLAGVYGVTHRGPWYLGAALAFANNWFTTNRTALGDQLTANFQGQSYSARLESGYRFALPAPSLSSPAGGGGLGWGLAGVTPYAALQTQDFHTPSYSETDLIGGGFGLSYNAMTGTDTRSELGSRFDDLTALNNLPLILRAKVAWAHDWVSNPSLNASFESLPGSSFTVNGAPIPHDSALTSAGAQLFFTPNWSLTAKFDGEFANGYQLYAGSGTLRYTW